MDPSSSSASPSSFNLAEIWPFPLSSTASVSESGVLSGRRFVQDNNNMGTGSRNLDGSTVTEYGNGNGNGNGNGRKRTASEDESSKLVSTSSGNNELNDSNGKRIKSSSQRDDNGDSKAELEGSSGAGNNKPAEQSNQPLETPKQDYIHVRARRGQATDSHSLAERARREKISERMKILQDLVPGCNKVIGKAMVLDEIINYIQSLQRQVEFLSMKLEAVNSRVNPSFDGFPPKDFGAQPYDAAGMPFSPQATREYGQGSAP